MLATPQLQGRTDEEIDLLGRSSSYFPAFPHFMPPESRRQPSTGMLGMADDDAEGQQSQWPSERIGGSSELMDILQGISSCYPSSAPPVDIPGTPYLSQYPYGMPELQNMQMPQNEMTSSTGSLYTGQGDIQPESYQMFSDRSGQLNVSSRGSESSLSQNNSSLQSASQIPKNQSPANDQTRYSEQLGAPLFVQLTDAKLGETSEPTNASGNQLSKTVHLHLEGSLTSAIDGWTDKEAFSSRRILWFTREQYDAEVRLKFKFIDPEEWVPDMVAISCILDQSTQSYYFTSIDYINLLEFIVGRKLSIEEKNRTRRNLEAFKPMTISKHNVEHGDFFWLIMSFCPPRPRNIVREIKVFPWEMLQEALNKIVSKYRLIYDKSYHDGEDSSANEFF